MKRREFQQSQARTKAVMKIPVSLKQRVIITFFRDVVLKVHSQVFVSFPEENTKVTRKVLADLSNLGGNTLRPALPGNNTV